MNWMEKMYRAMTPAQRLELYHDCLPKPGHYQSPGAKEAVKILEALIAEDKRKPEYQDEEDCC